MNYRMVLSKLNFSILVLLFILGVGGCSVQTTIVAHDKVVSWTDRYDQAGLRHYLAEIYQNYDPKTFDFDGHEKFTKDELFEIVGCKLRNSYCDFWKYHPSRLLWGDIDNVEQPFKMAALAWLWWLPFVFWFALGQWVRWLFKNDPKGA